MMVDWQRAKNWLRNAGLLALVSALLSVPAVASAADDPPATPFVRTSGTQFTVDGKPFFVAGVNNHYLVYGSLDGRVPTIWDWRSKADAGDLGVKGTYLLYWDPQNGGMAINDGPDGIQKVDFLIAEAGKRHLRLIIAFLDFWDFAGGVQQMRAWYGSEDKSGFFFEDTRTKRDYRSWVSLVVQRVNPLTGLAYRNDPTIMAWELMNEGNAKPETLRLAWTAEMSAYVKALDPNHLVTSGHANILERISDLAIPTLDFGTWHGYPIFYKLTPAQFNDTITEFCGLAARAQKPVIFEEFGYARSNPDSVGSYATWLDTLTRDRNCAGWMVWRLVSRQDSGRYPTDQVEQFDVHNDGGALWNVLKAATARAAQTRDVGPTREISRKSP